MSILSLHFGQCGNQIGQTLYKTLEEDITLKTTNSQHYWQSLAKWFNVDSKGRWKARSILVDTEPKVIKDMRKSWFDNIIVEPVGGSANNWAYGYVENSKLVASQVLNLVRKELEDSDFVSSFLNFYSLSGGTGSGVGSYVIEKLRSEYPKNTIVNCAILPYVKGEISTQAYNCLLNLSTLYSIGDCTILFENERLLHLSKYSLNLNTVTYSNVNSIISQQVASIFQPIVDKSYKSPEEWAEEDKLNLLLALKTHGTSLPKLEEALPHKSITEIKNAIDFYKSAAQSEKNDYHITKWLQIVAHLQAKNAGTMPVARTLKYIAMFEKNTESDVDLNEAMMFVSEVSRGSSSAELSNSTGLFVLRNLKKMARNLKFQDNTAAIEYFQELQDLDEIKRRNTKNNPLGVPKKLLHLTAADLK